MIISIKIVFWNSDQGWSPTHPNGSSPDGSFKQMHCEIDKVYSLSCDIQAGMRDTGIWDKYQATNVPPSYLLSPVLVFFFIIFRKTPRIYNFWPSCCIKSLSSPTPVPSSFFSLSQARTATCLPSKPPFPPWLYLPDTKLPPLWLTLLDSPEMGSTGFEAFHAATTLPVQPSSHRSGVYWSPGTLCKSSVKLFLRNVQQSLPTSALLTGWFWSLMMLST